MLDAVISLQFSTVETIWRHFWRSANNNEAVDVGMEEDPEKMLPKYTDDLYLFCVFFFITGPGGCSQLLPITFDSIPGPNFTFYRVASPF